MPAGRPGPGAVIGIAAAVWAAALCLVAADATAADRADVVILSPYRSLVGANGRPRLLPHAGVDLAAPVGTVVLAAADGVVSQLIDYEPGCGIGVVLSHAAFRRWTAYCHLTRALVTTGQAVARGTPIGLSGASGNSANVPHLHLELCTTACASHRDGDLRGTLDPLASVVGCFERGRAYPVDRLVLTLPLPCRRGSADAAPRPIVSSARLASGCASPDCLIRSARLRLRLALPCHVEAEVADLAVLDLVVLAFEP